MLCNTCYLGGEYCNPSFGEVFQSARGWLEAYKTNGIPTTISDESATTLFYLLYAKYGNTPIKMTDSNLFAYKCFQIVFQYAPTWEKRLEVQKIIRQMSLTDGELFQGGKAIYNHAMHDGSAPTTQTLTELRFIDSQNTTNYKKSKAEGLALMDSLLVTDVTEELLSKFKPLFSQWLKPDTGIVWFVTDPTDDDGTGGVDDGTTGGVDDNTPTQPDDDSSAGI